jgi:hypothetical protein
MIRVAGPAIPFLAAGSQIALADFTQEVRRCDSDGTHPDIRIVACTRNIQSGRFTGPNLATAFMNRGLAYEKNGEPSQALRDFEKAHALGFRHPLLLKKLREAGTVL